MWQHKTTADWFATTTKETGEVLPFKMETGGAVISTAMRIIYNLMHCKWQTRGLGKTDRKSFERNSGVFFSLVVIPVWFAGVNIYTVAVLVSSATENVSAV